MTKQFDVLVTIGRFQPFHNGHKAVIDEALKRAKEVIVVVGSSFAARNIRNPFTFEERKEMIDAVYTNEFNYSGAQGRIKTPRVKVVPVSDYPYDDNKWVAAVQNVVHGAISWSADPVRIGLIGHEKDGTSYYLKIFPTWGNVSVPNVDGINATDIRKEIFDSGDRLTIGPLSNSSLPTKVREELASLFLSRSTQFDTLYHEYQMIKKYKEAWKAAPFPPTFMTVDAVVVQSGHILLVKRGDMPGKGLWALPGGFLNQEETMLDGAIRELKEETKIKVPVPVLKGSIKESKTFDAPNRSARGRTITQAFYIDLGFDEKLPKVKGSDDAEKAFWVPLNEVVAQRDKFFEDHFHIISYFTKVG
jgi:bifunctional NMN adenylyltransferase/nudix hydrolase